MVSSSLDLAVNPKEYFRQKICAAARKNNINVSQDVEYYLVNLLCDFIVPDKISTILGEHSIIDTPLALIQKKALEAPPEEKIKIFKSLGDASLYISGYFEDFFNRKTFTVEYFINLGSNAYSSVSDLLQQKESRSHFRELYSTLSNNFQQYVDIYSEIGTASANNQNLLATYDKWLNNGSERLRRKLESQGIIPIDGKPNLKQ